MSKYIILWLTTTVLTLTQLCGQTIINSELTICYNKTTSIVFPFAITSVDRGSQDVLAQKAVGVENVLQVKAGQKNFPETNLTVITADGKLHHFTVNYSEAPAMQAVAIDLSRKDSDLILAYDAINEKRVTELSEIVAKEKSHGKVDRDKKYQMKILLRSIHVSDDIVLYRIQLVNNSAINYDIKALNFYIRDSNKVKRTSRQEVDVQPIFVYNHRKVVNGFGTAEMVFALKKFTIPDSKNLLIDLFEENGGRNLSLKIKNRDILKAKLITTNEQSISITKK